MKFVSTKRFSPVIYEGDLPHELDPFHIPIKSIKNIKEVADAVEKGERVVDTEWWEKQRDRCLNGYRVPLSVIDGGDCFIDDVHVVKQKNGVRLIPHLGIKIENDSAWITGKHYFYLNFWKINRLDDEGERKRILNPKFTDLSFENWHVRDQIRRIMKDAFFAKCRQKGLSEEEAADSYYTFVFYPESIVAILSGVENKAKQTFEMVKRGAKHLINTQFYIQTRRDNDGEYHGKYNGSEMHCRTTQNDVQAASGLTPTKVHMEETGLWKKGYVIDTADFIKPSIEAEGVKTGFLHYTGTGGFMEDSVDDMEKMLYAPEKYNLFSVENTYEQNDGGRIAYFVPAWKFKIIDEDGNSLKKESLEYLKEEEAAKGSAKERYRFKTQNPITPADMFMIASGGYFGEEVTMMCNQRKAYLLTHKGKQTVQIGRLEWKDPQHPLKGVKWIPDPDHGSIMISEHPVMDNDGNVIESLYSAGTDSYDQDEAAYSTSMGACWMWKGFYDNSSSYNKFVAGIIERPKTSEGGAEMFYQNTAKLCVYYRALNLIEWSKIRIFDWYHRTGLSELLMLRPELAYASNVNSNATNKWGIDPSTKIHWLAFLSEYLQVAENIAKCDFPELLTAWGKYIYDPSGRKYNCDNTIATSLCVVAKREREQIMSYERKRENFSMPSYKIRNGKLVNLA